MKWSKKELEKEVKRLNKVGDGLANVVHELQEQKEYLLKELKMRDHQIRRHNMIFQRMSIKEKQFHDSRRTMVKMFGLFNEYMANTEKMMADYLEERDDE